MTGLCWSEGEKALSGTAGVCVHTGDSVLMRGRVCFLLCKFEELSEQGLRVGTCSASPATWPCLLSSAAAESDPAHPVTSWNSSPRSVPFFCAWDKRRWTNALIFPGHFTTYIYICRVNCTSLLFWGEAGVLLQGGKQANLDEMPEVGVQIFIVLHSLSFQPSF